jgi:hypothetical protein
MRLLGNIARLLYEVTRFGVSTRRWSLVVAVLLGLVALALAVSAGAAAPLVIYPFA